MSNNKFPTYNGQKLPGFNTTLGFNEPRWMIVWDDKGWTCPCRRVIVCFNGRFIDTDGNAWDNGSELPSIGAADIWWKAVPMETFERIYEGTLPPWAPLSLKAWYEGEYIQQPMAKW